MSTNKSIHEFRFSRRRGTVWVNESDSATRALGTFSRVFQNKDQQSQNSFSIGRDDLPLLLKAASDHRQATDEQ